MRTYWAGAALATTLVISPVAAQAQPTITTSADASVSVASAARSVAAKPKKYANCTALNKVYKHGVGRKGARDKVKGSTRPVKNFTVNSTVYNLNKKSDRDKDGIACEKR